jgi:hypothetical protein
MSSKLSSGHVAFFKVSCDLKGYERENIFLYPDGLGIIVDDDQVIGETDIELLDCLLQHTDHKIIFVGVFAEDDDISETPLPPLSSLDEGKIMDKVKLQRIVDAEPELPPVADAADDSWGLRPLSVRLASPDLIDCKVVVTEYSNGDLTVNRRKSSVYHGRSASRDLVSWSGFALEHGYAFHGKSLRPPRGILRGDGRNRAIDGRTRDERPGDPLRGRSPSFRTSSGSSIYSRHRWEDK